MSPALPEINRYLIRLAATPLVPVRLGPGQPEVWCKREFLNPSGSTKDRVARVVTVFADRVERYFTTELFRPFAAEG
jgi:cysteine synthase A